MIDIIDTEVRTPLYINALHFAVLNKKISIRLLVDTFLIGFGEAGRIIDWMEEKGYISSFNSSSLYRIVLLTSTSFAERYGKFEDFYYTIYKKENVHQFENTCYCDLCKTFYAKRIQSRLCEICRYPSFGRYRFKYLKPKEYDLFYNLLLKLYNLPSGCPVLISPKWCEMIGFRISHGQAKRFTKEINTLKLSFLLKKENRQKNNNWFILTQSDI